MGIGGLGVGGVLLVWWSFSGDQVLRCTILTCHSCKWHLSVKNEKNYGYLTVDSQ